MAGYQYPWTDNTFFSDGQGWTDQEGWVDTQPAQISVVFISATRTSSAQVFTFEIRRTGGMTFGFDAPWVVEALSLIHI